jgi:biopolymer transport protein ExbB/TolQ
MRERAKELQGMWETIVQHYNDGGVWMFPITLFQIFSFAVILERVWVLFLQTRLDKNAVLAGVKERIFKGDVMGAIRFLSDQRNNPLARILKEGLLHVKHGEEEVQAAMDEASMHEMPYLEKRTGYLAMISNGATLAGLLGTIIGMIKVFAAVAQVSAADKSIMLSSGISEAMNCTAYGLITAIPPLVVYSFLQARMQEISDECNASVASTVNMVLRNKGKLNLQAIEERA